MILNAVVGQYAGDRRERETYASAGEIRLLLLISPRDFISGQYEHYANREGDDHRDQGASRPPPRSLHASTPS
jgi:hypothetical protein